MTNKVDSITMPPDLARLAEELCKKESRTMSELMREAVRRYQKPQPILLVRKVCRMYSKPEYCAAITPGRLPSSRLYCSARKSPTGRLCLRELQPRQAVTRFSKLLPPPSATGLT